jgi:hypothetical protein
LFPFTRKNLISSLARIFEETIISSIINKNVRIIT